MKQTNKHRGNGKSEPVEKRSISAPPEVFDAAEKLMKERMINSFSEYVRILIRKDAQQKAA